MPGPRCRLFAVARRGGVAVGVGQLSQDLSLLLRQEAQLAKTEIQGKVSRATRDLVSLATGGIVASLGGLALAVAIVLHLVDPIGLKPWLAALIVAVVFGGGGYRDPTA